MRVSCDCCRGAHGRKTPTDLARRAFFITRRRTVLLGFGLPGMPCPLRTENRCTLLEQRLYIHRGPTKNTVGPRCRAAREHSSLVQIGAVFLNVRNKQRHCRLSQNAACSCGRRDWPRWCRPMQRRLVDARGRVERGSASASSVRYDTAQYGRRCRYELVKVSVLPVATNHRRCKARSAARFQSRRHSRKPARLNSPATFDQRSTPSSAFPFAEGGESG